MEEEEEEERGRGRRGSNKEREWTGESGDKGQRRQVPMERGERKEQSVQAWTESREGP